jgi:hypothetical protein
MKETGANPAQAKAAKAPRAFEGGRYKPSPAETRAKWLAVAKAAVAPNRPKPRASRGR